jgi:hypothetical protein
MITYFILAPFLKNKRAVRTASDAGGSALAGLDAQFALLHRSVVGRGDRAVGTAKDAGVTAYAFIMVDGYYAVRNCKSAGDTTLDAQRLLAVTAGNGETYAVFFFYLNLGPDLYVFQSPRHVFFVVSGKGTVILAQMTAQTPLFVYIDPLHSLPLWHKKGAHHMILKKPSAVFSGYCHRTIQ